MKPTREPLRAALRDELHHLQAKARLTASAASALNGLALDPDTERPDLVPESSVVRELATLLEHAVQNLARQVATESPRGRPPINLPRTHHDNDGRTHEARSAQVAPARVPPVCLQS